MEKEIKVGIHNRFDFVRRDAKTGEILGEYKAENIILNNFWAKYLSSNSNTVLKYIHFGSGTAEPVVTDIKLGNWVGYKEAPIYTAPGTTYNVVSPRNPLIVSVKKTVRLEDTEYNGNFISEVGFSSATTSTSGLLTKALVKDMNGNVVSIEKKAGEVLDIFATFFMNCGSSLDDGNVFFGATIISSDTFIGRFLGYDNPLTTNFAASYLQGRPQAQAGGYNNYAQNKYPVNPDYGIVPVDTFDVPNRKFFLDIPNLTADIANIQGGIRGLMIADLLINLPCTGIPQPVITKEVVGTGDGTTKDFSTAFGYIRDNGTCKVYVNDVEVSAAIDYGSEVGRTNLVNDMIIVDYYPLTNTTEVLGREGSIGGPTVAVGDYIIAENPAHLTIPINSIRCPYTSVYASDDLSNWTLVANRTTSVTTPLTVLSGFENSRYWKFVFNDASGFVLGIDTASMPANIHLATASAVGDTVAVTYQPDCIAKDAQHVLNNVKVTLTFNEYTPT